MTIIDDLIHTLRIYKSSHMLASAVGLGVLNALAQQQASINDISIQCKISQGYSRIFLRVLDHFGLAQRTNNQYQLTPLGDEAVKNEMFCSFCSYHMYGFGAWSELRNCCRTGSKGGRYHQKNLSDPNFCRAYLLAMESIAQSNLSFLQERCRPLLRRRILDIGAGPSTLCRHLSQTIDCHVTGLDRPQIIQMARELFSYPENFTWETTDFHDFMPQKLYDGIFCSHFLEYCSKENLASWLKKIGTLICPGGVSVFVVFLRTEESDINLKLDLFEISTGLNSETLGYICTIEEMESALLEQGCSDIVISSFPKSASYSEFLVTCKWS